MLISQEVLKMNYVRNLFILTYLCVSFSFSQSSNWWVFLKDKDCEPVIALSDRAIDRRVKQNIEIDIHDFSICPDYIDSLKQLKISIRHQLKWFNAVSVSVSSDTDLKEIKKLHFVKDVRPVCKMVKQKNIDVRSLDFSPKNVYRTSLSLPYGVSLNQIQMLGGHDLHNEGFLGHDMIIAVFDAGFTSVDKLPVFDSLWNNNKILDMYDFVDNDSDVFGGSSHGTMVLSTMGGYMIDSLIGTAPEASYMLFRTEDSSSETLVEEDNWAAAAEYADSAGVDIINSSLGYTILYDDLLNSHSYSDMDGNSTIVTNAADLAASRGMLVVNSGGNSGNSDWYYIGAPADGDSVLSVGAVNSFGEIASFSSRGPSYDGRVKPNICAQGVASVVADLDSTIRVANGTSFSAPIIAGLSACLWSSDTTLNNMDLLNLIESSAHLFVNPNDSLGYGIPNFYMAYLNNSKLDSYKSFLDIYPNPFREVLSIYNNHNMSFSFDIFNLYGVIVFSGQVNSFMRINELSGLQSGVYILKIKNQDIFYPIIKM